ncbi:TlpA disulfide reductase family protein [Namhaeicola litoreus]|uniref:TlpA disulfide reductase family protein n=1 Tax=Namhaeicola litoreus TaxID=1052145 RepID=A0ABW3Y1R1_9FLAO
MRLFQLVFLFLIILSCKKEISETPEEQPKSADKQEIIENNNIRTVDYDGLLPFLSKNDDKVYVVNFWATWCKPCVEELPFFEKINVDYKDQNVEVLLVSLDFPTQIEEKVIPFMEKNQIRSEVILMSDPDQNNWIPKIDETWSGAIPATIIYNKNKRAFFEKAFTYEELITELNKFLNP